MAFARGNAIKTELAEVEERGDDGFVEIKLHQELLQKQGIEPHVHEQIGDVNIPEPPEMAQVAPRGDGEVALAISYSVRLITGNNFGPWNIKLNQTIVVCRYVNNFFLLPTGTLGSSGPFTKKIRFYSVNPHTTLIRLDNNAFFFKEVTIPVVYRLQVASYEGTQRMINCLTQLGFPEQEIIGPLLPEFQ